MPLRLALPPARVGLRSHPAVTRAAEGLLLCALTPCSAILIQPLCAIVTSCPQGTINTDADPECAVPPPAKSSLACLCISKIDSGFIIRQL
ncbi:unnamed protein product [Rangifer tarandus platyrhynchus]|uniref:Uncharacterized protein n=2 Tax=Rangifer tarandus platyrhynchus TaxID=3082113 RepID=A0ACB0FDU8_RANTA|nr:unnamed protein product [Rangifer tarandus platyrhynchus]CAI9711227.1 unnamed protein product [Rangifer tarandus platyrhynchus]